MLEYLVRHGSEACVAQARGGLAARLEGLASAFHYVSPDGRDMGGNVRHRCAVGHACMHRSAMPLQAALSRATAAAPALLPAPAARRDTEQAPQPLRRLCRRAQAILALLRDEGRLVAEREAHARKRGAYQGFSSYDMMAQARCCSLSLFARL